MNIEQYIAQLLYRYQCVTVPDFGAFLTEIRPAKLDENTNTFIPPTRSIFFNRYLNSNDGLLANHISQTEKISYEQAVIVIQNNVYVWKKILEEKGVLDIKKIGYIALSVENNLVFDPYKQINYLTDSFGLTGYTSPLIKRFNNKIFVEKTTRNKLLSFGKKENILKLENIKQQDLFSKEMVITTNNQKSNGSTYYKYAAVFVIGLGIISFQISRLYEDQINQEKVIVEKVVQKQIEQKIQQATFFIENPLPKVILIPKEEKLAYHIVAGAFREEINAEKKYNSLLKLGFKAIKLEKNKYNLYSVLYGSYARYEEAQEELSRIQKQYSTDAWILIEE